MAGKEPMSAESFSEDDYANNLIDKEGYSEPTARMLASKKKESLANAATKIEINLGSLQKVEDDDEDFEHLPPEERKKRQAERDRRQKERAVHRAVRQKQHDGVEDGIPEGKMESVDDMFFKAKKRVYVPPTAKKVGYYRMQEVGRKESNKKVDMSAFFDDLESHIELLQETANTTRNRDYEGDLNARIKELKGCLKRGDRFIYNDTGEGDDWMYLETYTPKAARKQYDEWNEE